MVLKIQINIEKNIKEIHLVFEVIQDIKKVEHDVFRVKVKNFIMEKVEDNGYSLVIIKVRI